MKNMQENCAPAIAAAPPRHRSRVVSLIAILLLGALASGIATHARRDDDHNNAGDDNAKNSYAIGLWGDLPYSDVQAQTGVPNIIADMNSQDIQFSVHDGDLKAGNGIPGSATPTTCQLAVQPTIYSQALGYFDSLRQPAIFTPGDNDW